VTGDITITNQNSYAVAVSVGDVLNDGPPGTAATVTCPGSATPGTGTVPAAAGGEPDTLVCHYAASPSGHAATVNTATVSVSGRPDVVATHGVSWTENLIGESPLLTDPDQGYSQTVSGRRRCRLMTGIGVRRIRGLRVVRFLPLPGDQ